MQRVSAIFFLMQFETSLISQRSRLNHTSGLTISLMNPERKTDDRFMTTNVECGCEFYFQSLHDASPT